MIIRKSDFRNQDVWNMILDELISRGLVEARDGDEEYDEDIDVEILISTCYFN